MNSQAKSPLILANNISHTYGDKLVLKNVSLSLSAEEIITIIGPNGAGKSTLLKILLGIVSPSKGQVIKSPELNVGFLPQKINITPTMPITVKKFILLGKPRNISLDEFDSLLQEISTELQIADLLSCAVQSLSGGEMQKCLLARALIRKPNLLILDEPTQGVDIHGQNLLYNYLSNIRQRYKCGIVMVSHDLHFVMKNTDNVICLNQHICCSGHPQDITADPNYNSLFGMNSEQFSLYTHQHNKKCAQIHKRT